jgi:menaquinone-dependent protoporphyrinogen oxidase
MPEILVAHATTNGHTARVAAHVAARLRAAGHDVLAGDVDDLRLAHVAAFDAVVVAGSVHLGRHQARLVRWLRERHGALGRVPCALLSVSLTAVDAPCDPAAAAECRRMIDDLCEETGVFPRIVRPVGGALRYTDYDAVTRAVVHQKARAAGFDEPADRDYDLTDWDAVDAVADEVAALAARRVTLGV